MSEESNKPREEQARYEGDENPNLSVRGQGSCGETSSHPISPSLRSSASFLWVDRESGEELKVEVRGDEAFFEELVAIGFKRESSRDQVEGGELKPSLAGPGGEASEVESKTSAPDPLRLSASMDVNPGRGRAGCVDNLEFGSGSWGSCRGA
jgi:hypothetical protein